MGDFASYILDAKMYADLCNNDIRIIDFCEHFNCVYKNLEAAKRIAMRKGPMHSFFEVNRDMRKIRDNMQASYRGVIERCYKYYYSSISHDIPYTQNDFIKEIKHIYFSLNEENRAFVNFCVDDLRDLISTIKEFKEMESAETLRQNALIEAYEKVQAEKRFKELCDDALVQERTWVREMKGFPSIEEALTAIDAMEGHEFEYWCAALLRSNGYTDVEVTRGSGDQGVDVLASKGGVKYAIQCKCYHSDLGNTPVQEIYAGKSIYGCHVGAVMTNRYFTKSAKEAAAATGVLLWDRDAVIEFLETMQTPMVILQ